MQLGWVDFSKEDRAKVLDVINLFQEQGALDELGLGMVRDGFSNFFFPGTSTIQTRAKYFLIIPYILKEAIDGEYGINNIQTVLNRIDEEEKQCGILLKENDPGAIGIIGERVLPNNWVARRPSDIYWNGLKSYHIIDCDVSGKEELIRLAFYKREKSSSAANARKTSENKDWEDDKDAGQDSSVHLVSLPAFYYSEYKDSWRDDLEMALTPEEALFLEEKIIQSFPDSLLAFIMNNQIDLDRYDALDAFYAEQKELLPEEMAHHMDLALRFDRLTFAARARYNVMYSQGDNGDAVEVWESVISNPSSFTDIDLEDVFHSLDVYRTDIKQFLRSFQGLLIKEQFENIDELLIEREKRLKGPARAKLLHPENYRDQGWVGGRHYDYRFTNAKRLILDIYAGKEGANV